MPVKAVFIDDERYQIQDYIRPLAAAGVQCVLLTQCNELKAVVDGSEHNDASVFIVDMMMPPGDRYKDAPTSDGLFTGLFVCRDLRTRFPTVPIILWTSAHLERIKKEAERYAGRIPNCRYARKDGVSPEELTTDLMYYVRKGRFRGRFIRSLWRIGVRMGIRATGLGADVKELSSQ